LDNIKYRALFEDAQGQLERNLENLHSGLEPIKLRKMIEMEDKNELLTKLMELRVRSIDLLTATDSFITAVQNSNYFNLS
jgi:hypothetical protein